MLQQYGSQHLPHRFTERLLAAEKGQHKYYEVGFAKHHRVVITARQSHAMQDTGIYQNSSFLSPLMTCCLFRHKHGLIIARQVPLTKAHLAAGPFKTHQGHNQVVGLPKSHPSALQPACSVPSLSLGPGLECGRNRQAK